MGLCALCGGERPLVPLAGSRLRDHRQGREIAEVGVEGGDVVHLVLTGDGGVGEAERPAWLSLEDVEGVEEEVGAGDEAELARRQQGAADRSAPM